MGRHLTVTMGTLRGLLLQHKAFLSAHMLAIVADVPQVRLAAALRGDCYLGSETETELLALARACVDVVQALLPLRLAPGDAGTLKLLVESGRSPEAVHVSILNLLERVDN